MRARREGLEDCLWAAVKLSDERKKLMRDYVSVEFVFLKRAGELSTQRNRDLMFI